MAPSPDLGLACPEGGKFYVCDNTTVRFIGCCTHDPCVPDIVPTLLNNTSINIHDGRCGPGALKPASFATSAYDAIPSQDCAGPVDHINNPLHIVIPEYWYTCTDTSPPFLGCCQKDACSLGGCPISSLTDAVLSYNATNAAVFLGPGGDNGTDPAQDGGDHHDGAAPGGAGAGTGGDQQEGEQDGNSRKYLPMELGIGIGALAIILVTVAWYAWKHKRDKKRRKRARAAEELSGGVDLKTLVRPAPEQPALTPAPTPTLAYNTYSSLNVARDIASFDRPRMPPKPPVRPRPAQYSGPTSIENLGRWSLRPGT